MTETETETQRMKIEILKTEESKETEPTYICYINFNDTIGNIKAKIYEARFSRMPENNEKFSIIIKYDGFQRFLTNDDSLQEFKEHSNNNKNDKIYFIVIEDDLEKPNKKKHKLQVFLQNVFFLFFFYFFWTEISQLKKKMQKKK